MPKKKLGWSFALAALVAVAGSFLYSNKPAAALTDAETIRRATQYSYYQAMVHCAQPAQGSNPRETIPSGDANNPQKWMTASNVLVGYIVDPQDGARDCSNLVTSALSSFAYGNPTGFLEDMGYTLSANGTEYRKNSTSNEFINRLKSRLESKGVQVTMTPEIEYKLNIAAFVSAGSGCKATQVSDYPGPSEAIKRQADSRSGGYVKITLVAEAGNTKDYIYNYSGGSARVEPNFNPPVGCDTIASRINSKAAQIAIARVNENIERARILFRDALVNDRCGSFRGQPGGEFAQCQSDYSNAFNQCFNDLINDNSFTYPNYNTSTLAACVAGKLNVPARPIKVALDEVAAAASAPNGSTNPTTPVTNANGTDVTICSAGTLSWIICPLTDILINTTQAIAEFLKGFLVFEPLVGTQQGKAIQSVWQSLLSIANVCLVIAFLAIIYSQATSIGLSNYGIKKLLPRIIVAAILINLSFYLCAFAIDVTNIVGAGVQDLMAAAIKAVGGDIGGSSGADITIFSGIATLGVTSMAITGAIFVILPILATAALSAFVALLTLIFRQVMLVLLVIVSPLAFAAMILPNTEGLFTKWRKAFFSLLIIYPIIMAVFYGSILVAAIINVTTPTTGTNSSWLETNGRAAIALLIQAIPLFALPFLLKSAGGIMERFGVAVNDKSKGIVDRSRKKADELKGRTDYQRNKEYRKKAKESRLAEDYFARLKPGEGGVRGAVARRTMYGTASVLPPGAVPSGTRHDVAELHRLANEQRKKHLMEKVNRETSEMMSAGALDAGAYYYEYDKNGTKVGEYADHGRAMTALARGENAIGVVKAGLERKEENATMLKGDSTEKRYAAMKRMTDIADGAALGYALYGDESQGIYALKDEQISDFVQFAGDNAGKISPKFSHLVTNDNGLNGVNGAALANWHGNEFKAAASRIRQLREQAAKHAAAGNTAEAATATNNAQKIQDAVETAYETLATDSNLEQEFKQKHVDAMRDFNEIVSGGRDRVVMREYGDKMSDPRVKKGRIADTTGIGTVKIKNVLIGNAVGKFK